jgi:hypothetical protein
MVKIAGNTSNNVMEVDANNNGKVNLPVVPAQAGFAALEVENDPGAVLGSRWVATLQASEARRLKVGLDTILFSEQFPGASINTALYQQQSTTMTIAVANGSLTLNAGASLAANVNAQVRTYKTFIIQGNAPLIFDCLAQFSSLSQPNSVTEWGLFIATGTTIPTDGVFFRMTSTGTLVCVANYNGIEVASPVLASSLIPINAQTKFQIYLLEDIVSFWINGQLVAQITKAQTGTPTISAPGSLPLAFRTYTTATAPASAQIIKVGQISLSSGDLSDGHTAPQTAASKGAVAAQGQTGQAMGSTENYGNSVVPVAAVPANAVLNFPAGLGGLFAITPTLAANTDGIVSSFQNPLGSSAIPGKTLFITGIQIDTLVTTLLNGGPFIGAWSLAFGHTAISLATVEGAGTKAARRVHLGFQGFAAGAAVGSAPTTGVVNRIFNAPIPVQPGEFIQTVLKNIGAVPASGTLTAGISFDGYWE